MAITNRVFSETSNAFPETPLTRIAASAINRSRAWVMLIDIAEILNSNRWTRGLFRRVVFLYRQLSPARPVRAAIAAIGEPFASTLCSMYDNEPQIGAEGKSYAIDTTTRIDPKQGMWIYQLLCDAKPDNTLEIGLAYGFSTVYFLAAIQANGKGHHVALDPYQDGDHWNGIGLAREKVLGTEQGIFEFSSENSIQGLTRFAREDRRFGVIFIDGDHTFDFVLCDFLLASLVCQRGGYIILDDMWLPSVRRVASFIRRNRSDFTEIHTRVPNIAVFKMNGPDRRHWQHFVPF